MLHEGEGYIAAQRKSAEIVGLGSDPKSLLEKLTSEYIEKGLSPTVAFYLVTLCKLPNQRGRTRELIRSAARIGDQRKELGWSVETITHTEEIELLRKLHPSRSRHHRRERK